MSQAERDLRSECRRLVRAWIRTARRDREMHGFARKGRLEISQYYKGTADASRLCAKQLREVLHG